MDLTPLGSVATDSVTDELIRDIDETANKVNEFRPLSPDVISSIQRDLVGERVYSSNALEGNTYTLGETVEILRTGYVDLGRKREATEVVNLGRAVDYVQAKLEAKSEPYTETSLLELHGILLTGIDDSIAGRYRTRRVMILGAKYQPPRDELIPNLMAEFFKELNSEHSVHAITLATWAHWAIARIHPFQDGNGRISRLWQDLVLFRNRLTCAIISPELKRDYLECLASADEGNFNPLIQLVCRRIAATFDRYIAAQQKADERSAWAQELVGEATARAVEKRRLSYLRWQRKMEELRYEFERCASTITHMSPDIQIQFKAFEIIDQAAWENVRSGNLASKSWFFQLFFRRNCRVWSYIFFFGKHFWNELDTEVDKQEPRVCLLISEQIDNKQSVRLDQARDNRVALKEVFVVGKSFARRRYALERGDDVLDHNLSAESIAQDFIREVVLHRIE